MYSVTAESPARINRPTTHATLAIQMGMLYPRGTSASRRTSHAMPMMMSMTIGKKMDSRALAPKSAWTYSWLERRIPSNQKDAVQPAIQKVTAESGATTLNRGMCFEQQPSLKGAPV